MNMIESLEAAGFGRESNGGNMHCMVYHPAGAYQSGRPFAMLTDCGADMPTHREYALGLYGAGGIDDERFFARSDDGRGADLCEILGEAEGMARSLALIDGDSDGDSDWEALALAMDKARQLMRQHGIDARPWRYAVYQSRNAWMQSNACAHADTLADAKREAESMGATHVARLDYSSGGVWHCVPSDASGRIVWRQA